MREDKGIRDEDNTFVWILKFKSLESLCDTVLDQTVVHAAFFDAGFGDRSIFGNDKLDGDFTGKIRVFRQLSLIAVTDLRHVSFDDVVDQAFVDASDQLRWAWQRDQRSAVSFFWLSMGISSSRSIAVEASQ